MEYNQKKTQEETTQVILNFGKEFSSFKGQYNSHEDILIDEKALLTIKEDEYIQKIFWK